MNKLISALLLTLSVILISAPVMADSTPIVQDVRPGTMRSWAFYDDTNGGVGTGTIVTGPLTPPLGTGSINFSLTSPTDGQIIASPKYNGINLSRVTKLMYSTYQSPSNPSNATAISLQLAIDANNGNQGYQGRMVYEPYMNNGGTVPLGQWTLWDSINGGAGKWWFTRSSQSFNGNCPQNNPCTWSQILSLYPNMRIHPTLGAVVLKAGSNWNGFSGNTDGLIIGLDGNDLIFNFDPALQDLMK